MEKYDSKKIIIISIMAVAILLVTSVFLYFLLLL